MERAAVYSLRLHCMETHSQFTALLDGKTGEDAPEDPEQLAQPHRAQGVAGSWHSPRDLWAWQ